MFKPALSLTSSHTAPAMRCALLGLVTLSATAFAQDLLPSAPPQSGPVLLLGGTIHPISGPAMADAGVLFDQGRIVRIDSAQAFDQNPEGTIVLNIDGLHVYPGLFAARTELGLIEISAVRAMRDTREVGDMSPEVRAAVSVNPDSTLLDVARANGVLTAAVFPSGGLIPGRASIIRLDGWTWEDMTILDDAGLIINWPTSYRAPNRWTGKAEPNRRAEQSLGTLSDFLSQARAYHALSPDDRQRDIRLDAVEPHLAANPPRLPLLINADELSTITSAVEWAVSHQLRIVIVGGRDAHLCTTLLREHNIPVIISNPLAFPSRTDSAHDEGFTLASKLEAAGITWCFAPADVEANVRNLPYDAAIAVAHGLDHDAAVRALTLSPATIFGLGNTLGSIEPGKAATLIVTEGSPLEITTNVVLAFIDGRAVSLESKHTQLRDKYIEKYRQLGLIPAEQPAP